MLELDRVESHVFGSAYVLEKIVDEKRVRRVNAHSDQGAPKDP